MVNSLDRTHADNEPSRRLWAQRGLGGVIDDATGVCQPAACILTPDEWEVAHLYAAFAFKKAGGDPSNGPPSRQFKRAGIIDRAEVKRINADGGVVDLL